MLSRGGIAVVYTEPFVEAPLSVSVFGPSRIANTSAQILDQPAPIYRCGKTSTSERLFHES
jgi:hypothetical protein